MNNWSISQTKELFNAVYDSKTNGKGLSAVFNDMAQKTGHSANSVRNYYYSQLKMFSLVPDIVNELGIKLLNVNRDRFVTFTQDEITNLVETVLINKAAGKSVRQTIATMSEGDARTALRLQNKYRSMLTHHKKQVMQIMQNLSDRGVTYYDPYAKTLSSERTDNFAKLTEYISGLDDKEVGRFLNLISKLI